MAKARENPLDEKVDYVVARMLDAVSAIPTDIPPFDTIKLSTEESVQRYAEMRENPQAWQDLLNEHGLKAVVEEAKKMEALYREHEERVNGREEALDGYAGPNPGDDDGLGPDDDDDDRS